LVQHADMRQCRKSVCVPKSPSLRSGLGRRHNGRRPTLDIRLAEMARVRYRLRSPITPCHLRVRSTPLIVENPSDPRAWRTSFAIGASSQKCATAEPQSAERSFTSDETSHLLHVPSKARIGSQRSAHAAMRRPEHKSLSQRLHACRRAPETSAERDYRTCNWRATSADRRPTPSKMEVSLWSE